jgi:F0F1-type ATP synthase assembly protein I
MSDEPDASFDKRLADALKRNDMDLTLEGAENPVFLTEDDKASGHDASSGLAYGMRLGVEFIAGTVVGLLIGWGLDQWLGTTPWLLLLFTLLGFGAGIMNVYRVIMKLDDSIGINRQNRT